MFAPQVLLRAVASAKRAAVPARRLAGCPRPASSGGGGGVAALASATERAREKFAALSERMNERTNETDRKNEEDNSTQVMKKKNKNKEERKRSVFIIINISNFSSPVAPQG